MKNYTRFMNIRLLYTLYLITVLYDVTAYHIHRMVMTYIFLFLLLVYLWSTDHGL